MKSMKNCSAIRFAEKTSTRSRSESPSMWSGMKEPARLQRSGLSSHKVIRKSVVSGYPRRNPLISCEINGSIRQSRGEQVAAPAERGSESYVCSFWLGISRFV
jgi:hypothetical protein